MHQAVALLVSWTLPAHMAIDLMGDDKSTITYAEQTTKTNSLALQYKSEPHITIYHM